MKVGLDIVFVGLNPSLYSARAGHYFANPRNRFWSALNLSGIVPVPVSPELDHTLPDHGIGFTDVVKRPTSGAADLVVGDFRKWAPVLKEKLERYRPRIACFHGLIAYRQYLKYAEGVNEKPGLGLQKRVIGVSKVFVVPNPSPANAHFSVNDLAGWYRRVGALREELKRSRLL